jgi:hypothetical protein
MSDPLGRECFWHHHNGRYKDCYHSILYKWTLLFNYTSAKLLNANDMILQAVIVFSTLTTGRLPVRSTDLNCYVEGRKPSIPDREMDDYSMEFDYEDGGLPLCQVMLPTPSRSKLRSGLLGPERKLGLTVHSVAGTAWGWLHRAATTARFQRWKDNGPLYTLSAWASQPTPTVWSPPFGVGWAANETPPFELGITNLLPYIRRRDTGSRLVLLGRYPPIE